MSDTQRVYKLTNEDLTSYGGFQYEVGRHYTFPGTGPLCGCGWSHCYTSPQLALLLNPIHAAFRRPRLWAADGLVGATDCGLKVGCSELTLVREIPVPEVTPEQRVSFALTCALAVHRDPGFVAWADGWLSGKHRSTAAADSAAGAAEEAARAARAGARAALAAAGAAGAAEEAALAAAWAALAAEEAAWAAAWAAEADRSLDLGALARNALLPWAPEL
jgi:hypothetical protein